MCYENGARKITAHDVCVFVQIQVMFSTVGPVYKAAEPLAVTMVQETPHILKQRLPV